MLTPILSYSADAAVYECSNTTTQRAFLCTVQVHIVVPEGQLRGGLPLWLGVAVSTMSAAEFQEAHGDQPIYGQQDAMQLLLNGAEWQVGFRQG